MRYQIQGETLPVVICHLEAGERMITEGGSMSWMSPNMLMETSTNGGLGKALGSCLLYTSGTMCVGCYLLASLSTLPILGLVGCALCGLGVGVMWPGSISISSQRCPRGGTAMFAFLALAGDLGAMVSPTTVSYTHLDVYKRQI